MTDRGDTFTEYAAELFKRWRDGVDLLVGDLWASERILTGLAQEADPELADRILGTVRDIQVQMERSGDAAQGALMLIERRSRE